MGARVSVETHLPVSALQRPRLPRIPPRHHSPESLLPETPFTPPGLIFAVYYQVRSEELPESASIGPVHYDRGTVCPRSYANSRSTSRFPLPQNHRPQHVQPPRRIGLQKKDSPKPPLSADSQAGSPMRRSLYPCAFGHTSQRLGLQPAASQEEPRKNPRETHQNPPRTHQNPSNPPPCSPPRRAGPPAPQC